MRAGMAARFDRLDERLTEPRQAERGAAPDRGRRTGFAQHQALAAATAGELGRSAALATTIEVLICVSAM